MEATQEQITELRTSFLNELGNRTDFEIHPKDLERAKTSDSWLQRFLMHHDLDQSLALNMMITAVKWRKEFGTNDITESNVRMDYLVSGGFFPYGRDKDGCAILIFKCKMHTKGQNNMEDLQRCLVYWFERVERQEEGRQVSVFFDMDGCGLSNLDMEFTRYLIGLFKLYYPYFLNYIFIFEMPWVLSAAFKIIKSWLPEKAVQRIRFVKRGDIKEYIPLEYALKCWGGLSDYTFSFVPEDLSLNETNVASSGSNNNNKKVHFADGSQMSDTPGTVSDAEPVSSADAGTLVVHPANIITFSKHGAELASNIQLHNSDPNTSLSYKMKTTSPEKFRVRPSAGYLEPGGRTVVTVSLQPGFQLGGLSRDKFLLMSMPVASTDMTPQELADVWKNAAGKNISEHRLKCAPLNEARNGSAVAVGQAAEIGSNQVQEISGSVRKVTDSMKNLHHRLERLNMYMLILIALLVVGFAVVFAQLLAVKAELKDAAAQSCYREAIL